MPSSLPRRLARKAKAYSSSVGRRNERGPVDGDRYRWPRAHARRDALLGEQSHRKPHGSLQPAPTRCETRSGKRFTDVDGTAYTCDTAGFPGLVETPDGIEEGLAPAWCVNGRFLLAYSGAGAIQESYSDIFGESLEFFYEGEGTTADYRVGGDMKSGPIRSLSDPKSLRDGFYPDVYRDRYEFALTLDEDGNWGYSGFVFVGGQYVGTRTEDEFGYGADHWNSLILSHAYYLAVEGGTHRTSGVTGFWCR